MSEGDDTEIAVFEGRIVVKAPFDEHQRFMELLRALVRKEIPDLPGPSLRKKTSDRTGPVSPF